MAARFTVYCWYDKDNRVQQGNFRRWNRRLGKDREAYEVIVFYDEADIRNETDRFENLRFWRLHDDMRKSPTGLLNEAMRYSRSEILVYVSPYVMARKADLYRLANFVRADYAMSWASPRPGFYHERKNKLASLVNRIRWVFRAGRLEFYAHLNKPFTFYRASFFALNKTLLNKLFEEIPARQRQLMFQSDESGPSFLNYSFFHHILQSEFETIHAGRAAGYDFNPEKPGLFYGYKNTCGLLRQMFKRDAFHFPLSLYRFLLPVMQLSQAAFLLLVWFDPWKSFMLLAFYGILASSVAVSIFQKKQWSPFVLPLWFFSWLVA